MRNTYLALVLVLPLCGQSRVPVFASQTGDGVDLLDRDGRRLRSVRLNLKAIEQVAFDGSGTYGVGVSGRCSDDSASELYEFSPRKIRRRLPLALTPSPLDPIEKEVISDPAVSPSGKALAFVTTVCDRITRDTTPRPGFLGVLERGAETPRAFQNLLDKDDAIPFVLTPSWSHDERLLLVNFETGFSVVRVADGLTVARSPRSGDLWNHAVGWIGSGCVVYVEGKDLYDAPAHEAKVINFSSSEVRSLRTVLGPAAAELRPEEIRWPFALSRQDGRVGCIVSTPPGVCAAAGWRERRRCGSCPCRP